MDPPRAMKWLRSAVFQRSGSRTEEGIVPGPVVSSWRADRCNRRRAAMTTRSRCLRRASLPGRRPAACLPGSLADPAKRALGGFSSRSRCTAAPNIAMLEDTGLSPQQKQNCISPRHRPVDAEIAEAL